MSLYKDKIRDVAIHASIEKVREEGYSDLDFLKLKIEYKWILKELIIEMQKEIDTIDNEIHGWETQG